MSYIALLSIVLASNILVGAFVYFYTMNKQKAVTKDRLVKALKKSNAIKKKYKDAAPDIIWDELSNGDWVR